MTTKSKVWLNAKTQVEDILTRMYDKDALGNPLNEDSPELLDPINRIANVRLEFNGYLVNLFPDHIARKLVIDELRNRKQRTN